MTPVGPDEAMCFAIRGHVAAEIGKGVAPLARVAELMGLHPRTLQRRLREAGVTYHGLAEGVRVTLAMQYVGRDAKPLAEVARDLGFHDAPPFSRAFRRWTGMTPREYRNKCRGEIR